MGDFFFEKEHKPRGEFPYIECENKNLTYISHYHEEIEVAYVERGSICGYAAPAEIPLSKGDICIFMPGEIHSFVSLEDNNIYIIKINVNSYIENINFERIRLLKNKISPTDESYKLFFDIIDEIHTEYTEKKAGYEFKIRALKNEFLSCVVRVSDYKIVNSTKNMNLLNDINKIIEEKYAERIALESIAELCHMSKYHFSHTFKRLTGMSFISYLTLFRTEKAAVLLRYTNKSMSDIAYECGFGNVRSFNRSFKETLNLTPLQYRAAAKKT